MRWCDYEGFGEANMMLQMEVGVHGFGRKERSDGMLCLSKRRCTGKYDRRRGMKRSSGRKCFRGFSAAFRPWKNNWHFFSYKDDGCWQRGIAGRDFNKRSVLVRSGQERIFIDLRVRGRRSLIHHPAIFHPQKHRVDCCVYGHDYGDDHYEFGISFDLDGVYTIDHVENWVVCHEDARGRWSCADCRETGDPQAEAGYEKATFDSKQALLLDHMEYIMKDMRYLCSNSFVDVFLNDPGDIGNSSSSVMLRCDLPQKERRSLVPVGKVEMSLLKSSASTTTRWIHEQLADELQKAQHKHQDMG